MSIRNTLSLKHLIEMHAYWEHHKIAPLSNAKAVGLLKHIRKEIVEIAKTPEDTEEYCDIAILALSGAIRQRYAVRVGEFQNIELATVVELIAEDINQIAHSFWGRRITEFEMVCSIVQEHSRLCDKVQKRASTDWVEHIKINVKSLSFSAGNVTSWVEMALMALMAAACVCSDFDEVETVLKRKLVKNWFERDWPKNVPDGEPHEHIRNAAE